MKVLKSGQWLLAVLLTIIGSIGHASMNEFTIYSNSAAGSGASILPDVLEMDTGESMRSRSGVKSYRRLKEMDSTTSNFGNLSNNVTQVAFQPGFDATGHLIASAGVIQSLTIIGATTSHQTEVGSSSSALALLPEWEGVHYNLKRGDAWSSIWLSALYNSIFNNLANVLDHSSNNGTLSSLFGPFSSTTYTGVFYVISISTVSSVPLPGAVWLFGSGLLVVIARRTKKHASLPLLTG